MPDSILIAQIIGTIAFITGKAAFLIPCDKTMKNMTGIILCFSATQYIFLNEIVTCFILMCAGVRFIVSSYTKNDTIMYAFIILFALIGTITYEKPIDLIPVLTSITITYGSFKYSDYKLRLAFIASLSPWIIYNIMVSAYVASLSNTLTVSLLCLTVLKELNIQNFTKNSIFATKPAQ